eukprot:COSAG04_NODE_14607_length_561_cov_31.402597_1_plen_95_part_10
MRSMSIRALGSAGSAGAGEPPSCATADSEGGEAGLEVAGEVVGPSTDASPLPPLVAVSAAAAVARRSIGHGDAAGLRPPAPPPAAEWPPPAHRVG